jgi:hypothetical protein
MIPTYFPPGYFGPVAVCPVLDAVVSPTTALYENTTFDELCDKLAERLGDAVWWTHEELCMYIVEALRTWNFLTQYHKERFTFSTIGGQAFYDITGAVPSLRGYSVVDTDLIKLLQYHLLEPATGTSWTGTEQFTYSQLLDSINRRANALLVETGAVLTAELLDAVSPPIRRMILSENTIDLRRAAWKSVTGSYRTLRRRDTAARRSYDVQSSFNPGTPVAYSQANLPQLSIELSPPSGDVGQLHVIITKAITELTGNGASIHLPDDFIPILKWGVLADLLSIAGSQDAIRTNYCEQQWQQGLLVADMNPSIIAAEVNGQAVPPTSLAGLDSFRANWQNESGRPKSVAAAGLDLIAIFPVPDGVYSITLDVVRKAVVPVNPTDFIQIGPEYIDDIIDYCIHLATFKQGGDEWQATNMQLGNFLEAAMMYNRRLKAESLNFEGITKQAYREKMERPREIAQGGVRP